jgi:hypothetical protein
MFYKITKFGDQPDSLGFKYSSIGMVEVMAAFYLEKGDDGYDAYILQHYVTVPVFPDKGYSGKVDKDGEPIDMDDFNKWISSLPTIQKLNPFCNHSIQFEPDMLPHDESGLTKESQDNIDYCFQWALGITAKNYVLDDLACKKGGQTINQDIRYLSRCAYYAGVSVIPDSNKTTLMKADVAKIASAKTVTDKAKMTNLTAIPNSLSVKK